MKQINKEEIDKLIAESLNESEAEFYNSLEEPGVFKMWFGLYTGKLGWWAILVTFMQLIFTALAFYLGYLFFTAEETELMIRYGGGLLIAMLFTQMLKLWHWMQMDKNSILREIKRLEFQVAVLMEKTASR